MSYPDFDRLRSTLNREHKTVLDRFAGKHYEECLKAIKDQIEIDKQHTAIVNMCAFAFSESGPLRSTGYHYVTVEPLFKFRTEKGNKLFDLALYRKDSKRAILIEVKSSIGDPRRDVLNPMKDQINNASTHKNDLEEEIGGEIEDLEYVVCAPPQDIEEIAKKIEKNEPVCLWSADIHFSTLKLYNPAGSLDSDRTGEFIRRKQLNVDENLRKKMYDKTKSMGQVGIRILPSSHICRILSRVIVGVTQKFLLSTTAQEKKFWFHELKDIVHDELPKTPIEDIERIGKEVCELAIKIKILEEEQNITDTNDPSYKLRIGAKSPKTVENHIEDQYIKNVCEKKSEIDALEEYEQFAKSNSGSLDSIFSRLGESEH